MWDFVSNVSLVFKVPGIEGKYYLMIICRSKLLLKTIRRRRRHIKKCVVSLHVNLISCTDKFIKFLHFNAKTLFFSEFVL